MTEPSVYPYGVLTYTLNAKNKMKKLLFSAMAAVVLLNACSKDDDASSSGSFTFNGTTANTNYGTYEKSGDGHVELTFSSYDRINTSLGDLSKKIHVVSIELDTFAAGTYTFYVAGNDNPYDATKHFRYADVTYNYSLSSQTEGYSSDNLRGGTVTLTGTAPNFGVSYTLDFDTDTKVAGVFNGKLVEYKEQ